MAVWLLQLPDAESGQNVKNGTSSIVVEADDLATARSVALAQFEGDADWASATATALSALSADYEGFTYSVKVSGDPDTPSAADVAQVSYNAVASDAVNDIGAALVPLLNATPSIAGALYTATTAVSAAVAAGGTGYTVGDTLILVGGTFTTAATFNVDAETAGVITAVSLVSAGNYTATPADPVSTTGGTGSGATLNVTFTATDTLTAASASDALGDRSVEVTVTPPSGAGSIPELVGTVTHEGAAGAALTAVLNNPTAIPTLIKIPSVRL